MWTCKCGASVDDGYLACWSCGSPRDAITASPPEPPAGYWACPKCGEFVEANFEVCWSCGTSREGVEDPTFERADDVEADAGSTPFEPHPDDATPSAREPIECLRCRGPMEEGFVADFRDHGANEPIRWFPGRPRPSFWTGTWSGGEPHVVRTYRCSRCGHLESFASPEV